MSSSFRTIKWQLAVGGVIIAAAMLGACGTADQAGAPPRTVTVTATPQSSDPPSGYGAVYVKYRSRPGLSTGAKGQTRARQ